MKKPFHIDKLTKKQWEKINSILDFRCGGAQGTLKRIFSVPEFTFSHSCKVHDLYFRRGGGIKDFVKGNWEFLKRNTIDTFKFFWALLKKDRAIINDIIISIGLILGMFAVIAIGLVYYILVSTFGLFLFNWGEYKDLKTIIKEAKAKS